MKQKNDYNICTRFLVLVEEVWALNGKKFEKYKTFQNTVIEFKKISSETVLQKLKFDWIRGPLKRKLYFIAEKINFWDCKSDLI